MRKGGRSSFLRTCLFVLASTAVVDALLSSPPKQSCDYLYTIPAEVDYVVLSDGRRLAYAEYGDLSTTTGSNNSKVVLHFHGSGGSRLERPPNMMSSGDDDDTDEDTDTKMLQELGIRFISIDRPGHGYSDPYDQAKNSTRSSLEEFVKLDVTELIQHLQLQQYFVEGWSAGGAYALACCRYLPKNQIIRAATLSGIAPPERPTPYQGVATIIKVWMFFARRGKSRFVQFFRRLTYKTLQSKTAAEIGAMLVPSSKSSLPLDEAAVAASPQAQAVMGANVKEGYRQGWQGAVLDDFRVNGPWGFRLEDLESSIDIWQAANDTNVPLCQGEYMRQRIGSNSRLYVLPDTAHLFPLIQWKSILQHLTRDNDGDERA